MAANRRVQRTNTYRTPGSVAYAPTYDRNAVRAPGREQVAQPKPRVRPKEKALTRTRVQVREAGQVSPFAVVGFLLVGVFAAASLLFLAIDRLKPVIFIALLSMGLAVFLRNRRDDYVEHHLYDDMLDK